MQAPDLYINFPVSTEIDVLIEELNERVNKVNADLQSITHRMDKLNLEEVGEKLEKQLEEGMKKQNILYHAYQEQHKNLESLVFNQNEKIKTMHSRIDDKDAETKRMIDYALDTKGREQTREYEKMFEK